MQKNPTSNYGLHTSPKLAAAQGALCDLCMTLDSHVAILQTVWLALGSPDLMEAYGPQPVREALEYSADRLKEAARKANDAAAEAGWDLT